MTMWYRKAKLNGTEEVVPAPTPNEVVMPEIAPPAPAPPGKFEYPRQLSFKKTPLLEDQWKGTGVWLGSRGMGLDNKDTSSQISDAINELRSKKVLEIEELKNRVQQGLDIAIASGVPVELYLRLVTQVSGERLRQTPEYQAYVEAHGENSASNLRTKMSQLVWQKASQFNRRQITEARQLGIPFTTYIREVGPIDIKDVMSDFISHYEDVDAWGNPKSEDMLASGINQRYFIKQNNADDPEDVKAIRSAQLASPLFRALDALGLLDKSSTAASRVRKMIKIINTKQLWKIKEEFEAAKQAGDQKLMSQISSEPKLTPQEREFQSLYIDGYNNVMEFARILGQFDSELAKEFITNSNEISYQTYARAVKPVPDKLYGEVFGLNTLSNPEREIMSIFRKFGLQPVPKDIKMQADGKDIWGDGNEYFKLDFLLPCDVWKGDEKGVPIIERQVTSIGEFFAMLTQRYRATKENKLLIEPFQAAIAGGDTLFIQKNNYSEEALQKLLDSKGIIYQGSHAEDMLKLWIAKSQQNPELSDAVSNIETHLQTVKDGGIDWLSAYIETVKMELQLKSGFLGQFKQAMSGPEGDDLWDDMLRYQEKINSWWREEKRIRTSMMVEVHVRQMVEGDYNANPTKGNLKRLQSSDAAMQRLRDRLIAHSKQFQAHKNISRLDHYKERHQQMLAQSDYGVRVQELNNLQALLRGQGDILQSLVDTHVDISIPEDKRTAVFVKLVCDRVVSGEPFETMLGRSALAARLARGRGLVLDPVVANWLAGWPDR